VRFAKEYFPSFPGGNEIGVLELREVLRRDTLILLASLLSCAAGYKLLHHEKKNNDFVEIIIRGILRMCEELWQIDRHDGGFDGIRGEECLLSLQH
jgi:hypothetical protein